MVGRFDDASGGAVASLPEPIRNQWPNLQTLVLSADVGQTVTGVIQAHAADDQAAEQLRATLTNLLSVARLIGNNDPALKAMLGSLQPSGTGRDVQLTFTITPDAVNRMQTMGGSGRPAFGSAPIPPQPPAPPVPPPATR
jgi:hypothetical protein